MSEEVNEGISKYTIKNLNLQKEPSKSAMIIKVIPAYSRFELLDSDDEWLKVSFNHREGYVAKGNVSVTKITTATTRLKTRPLKESKSMKTIKKHQVVEVVDQEGVFNQVFYEGKLGYVEADLLSDDGIKYQPDKLGNFYYNAEKFVNDRKIKSPTPFLVVTDLKAKHPGCMYLRMLRDPGKNYIVGHVRLGRPKHLRLQEFFILMGVKSLLKQDVIKRNMPQKSKKDIIITQFCMTQVEQR